MKIVHLPKLEKFAKDNALTKQHLAAWRTIVKDAKWLKSADVLTTFPKSKIIKNSRARFPIVGNNFRIVAEINYEDEIVDIRFVGSHAEYNKIDATTV
jgi:mRNA interferase HigB